MKFGIVLPSLIYNEYRRLLAEQAFESLLKTKRPSQQAVLFLLIKGAPDKVHPPEGGYPAFNLIHIQEPPGVGNTEQTLAYGTTRIFENPTVTHSVWMGDDALFNPYWLVELEKLINRHPSSRSWSVYRSAYEAVHAPLANSEDGVDVKVRSICGHCLTLERKEWQEWGIDYSKPGRQNPARWPSPSGDTLDMLHIHARYGDRWVTRQSYVQHTGRQGTNCHPGIPEYAQDFAGE